MLLLPGTLQDLGDGTGMRTVTVQGLLHRLTERLGAIIIQRLQQPPDRGFEWMATLNCLLQQRFGGRTGGQQTMLATVAFGLLFVLLQRIEMSGVDDLLVFAIVAYMFGNHLIIL